MKIQWKNKWSGETGFVKSINTEQQYFENTDDVNQAKVFSPRVVKKTVETLEQFCPDNTYHIGQFKEKQERKEQQKW